MKIRGPISAHQRASISALMRSASRRAASPAGRLTHIDPTGREAGTVPDRADPALDLSYRAGPPRRSEATARHLCA
ncbi:MAG: hypothetical protein WAT35_05015, partial [Tabrizicola sp.]|uniref:hypothetical protein n=1 Tax=Tabrizicola sp. TaxID=2005166 RepID=UPI003BAFB468